MEIYAIYFKIKSISIKYSCENKTANLAKMSLEMEFLSLDCFNYNYFLLLLECVRIRKTSRFLKDMIFPWLFFCVCARVIFQEKWSNHFKSCYRKRPSIEFKIEKHYFSSDFPAKEIYQAFQLSIYFGNTYFWLQFFII